MSPTSFLSLSLCLFLVHVVEDDHEAEELEGVHDEARRDRDLGHHVLPSLHPPTQSLEEAVEGKLSMTGSVK